MKQKVVEKYQNLRTFNPERHNITAIADILHQVNTVSISGDSLDAKKAFLT